MVGTPNISVPPYLSEKVSEKIYPKKKLNTLVDAVKAWFRTCKTLSHNLWKCCTSKSTTTLRMKKCVSPPKDSAGSTNVARWVSTCACVCECACASVLSVSGVYWCSVCMYVECAVFFGYRQHAEHAAKAVVQGWGADQHIPLHHLHHAAEQVTVV